MTNTDDTNTMITDRAARCHAALEAYKDAWDVRSNAIDVLADIRHWCDSRGESHAELDRVAHGHDLAELPLKGRPS